MGQPVDDDERIQRIFLAAGVPYGWRLLYAYGVPGHRWISTRSFLLVQRLRIPSYRPCRVVPVGCVGDTWHVVVGVPDRRFDYVGFTSETLDEYTPPSDRALRNHTNGTQAAPACLRAVTDQRTQ